MAVVVKYQNYPSTSYNWLSADGACKEMIDEFKTWLGLVNANPSQNGEVCTVLKDETSSTNALYYGMTIQMKDPDGSEMYARFHTYNANALQFEVGLEYDDGGQNGGYGDITGYANTDGQISFQTSGVDLDHFIAYNTVDGEEWFLFGWSGTAASFEDLLLIGKSIEGRWIIGCSDATSVFTSMASVGGGHMNASKLGYDANTQILPTPGVAIHNTNKYSGSGTSVDVVAFKSLDLWRGQYSAFGDWVAIDANNDDYLLYATGLAGIWVRTN